MLVSRELLEALVKYMNIAFEADENPFGIHHNKAADTLDALEVILESNR